jgi:hypothetical protein
VPTGCVPQGVPYTVRALLVQRLPEAGLGLRIQAQTIPVLELASQAPVNFVLLSEVVAGADAVL